MKVFAKKTIVVGLAAIMLVTMVAGIVNAAEKNSLVSSPQQDAKVHVSIWSDGWSIEPLTAVVTQEGTVTWTSETTIFLPMPCYIEIIFGDDSPFCYPWSEKAKIGQNITSPPAKHIGTFKYTINIYDCYGKLMRHIDPYVEVLPLGGVPTVSITTEEIDYSPGDIMNVTICLSNPSTSQEVSCVASALPNIIPNEQDPLIQIGKTDVVSTEGEVFEVNVTAFDEEGHFFAWITKSDKKEVTIDFTKLENIADVEPYIHGTPGSWDVGIRGKLKDPTKAGEVQGVIDPDSMTIEFIVRIRPYAAQSVMFRWWLAIPRFGYMTVIASIPLTLPADYDECFTFPIDIGDWGDSGFGAIWGVGLFDPSTDEIIDYDTSGWNYVPGQNAQEKITPAEIEKEITKEIGRVEFPS